MRETVPWAVFTDPEVAQAGSLAGDAHEWPLARHDRAQAAGLRRGLVRICSDRQGRVEGGLVCLEAAAHVYPSFGFPLQQLAAEAPVRDSFAGLRGRLLKAFVR